MGVALGIEHDIVDADVGTVDTTVPPVTIDLIFEESFEELYARAYGVAYQLGGRRSEAEDVAQETLARAYVRWSRIEGHVEPWVAKVAANQALKVVRKRQRRAPGESSAISDDLDTVALTRMGLAGALEALPRRQREVLVLRYLADLSEDAVARHLGCATGTVKQHAHRGLSKLRVLLDEEVNIAPTL